MIKAIKERVMGDNIYEAVCDDDKKYAILVRDKNKSGLLNSLRLEFFSDEKTAIDHLDKIERYVYYCAHCGFTTNNESKVIRSGSEVVLNQLCPKCGDNKYLRGEYI